MKIIEIENIHDIEGMSLFSKVATRVYQNDSVWVPQSENAFIQRFEASKRSRKTQMRPFVVMEGDYPVARAAAIFDIAAVDDQGVSQGWIGFFEYLKEYETSAIIVLERCEEVLRNSGAKSVLAVKADNLLVGLLKDGFDKPQTVLTGHNPPYYMDTFLRCGYEIVTGIKTLNFTRDSVNQIDIKLPGFVTRAFDRSNLDREITIFNSLQNSIFAGKNGYVSRTIDEDREMVQSFLPFIDDELIIIAQDNKGTPAGLLICLPDVYQAFKGEKVDRARIISIGVLPGRRFYGVGAMMGSHLMKNLLRKGYKTAEGSWILEGNLDPQNAAKRFHAAPGREYVLLQKNL
jgi:hypothetical protein